MTDMTNKNDLGFSFSFSCHGFDCRCLASLSRNHIFGTLKGCGNRQPVSPKNLKLLQTVEEPAINKLLLLCLTFSLFDLSLSHFFKTYMTHLKITNFNSNFLIEMQGCIRIFEKIKVCSLSFLSSFE